MPEEVRRLGDRSGNSVTCKVSEDAFELTWPDGTVLAGKAPRPWDTVLQTLDRPHYSLLEEAAGTVRASKSA